LALARDIFCIYTRGTKKDLFCALFIPALTFIILLSAVVFYARFAFLFRHLGFLFLFCYFIPFAFAFLTFFSGHLHYIVLFPPSIVVICFFFIIARDIGGTCFMAALKNYASLWNATIQMLILLFSVRILHVRSFLFCWDGKGKSGIGTVEPACKGSRVIIIIPKGTYLLGGCSDILFC
jgi:hypothetical protein